MKKILLLFVFALTISITRAGDGDFAVSKIPVALLKGANAVKRMEEIKYQVIDLNKAKSYRKFAYTILNENGDKYSSLIESYSKLSSIEAIEGRLYDAAGVKIKSLKPADIQDLSGTSDNNLADDVRIKKHSFYYRSYPYTVEYEIEERINYTMFYPGYTPVNGSNLAVVSSTMTLELPPNIQFRYKLSNIEKPVEKEENNITSYTWQLTNYSAVQNETFGPAFTEITPVVYMGPVQFAIEGYEGNMSNWQDFGKFVHALKANRDQLPADIKAKVHELTDNEKDIQKKIALLYNLLQKNTRYISVQLGIGGWQPFDATYVATKKYGDCKALTNYMYALLKEAGINSYYTLVKAGNNRKFFLQDFPSSQFNHAILSVPVNNDTLWLECTSQTIAPGFLGDFTDDRYALMIDEQGGKLVRTPRYDYTVNTQVRKINAAIDVEGNASINTATHFKALAQDDLQGFINAISKDKVKEYLNKSIGLPQYELNSFDYEEHRNRLPELKETLGITAKNYASVTGKRMFVIPNMFSKLNTLLETDTARKYDLVLNYGCTDIDSVEIVVPPGYISELLPPACFINSPFGKYVNSTRIEGDKIIYYRKMEKYSGRFPKTAYNELVQFYEKIYKADRGRVVLVKNN
jgi:Domain of Unknown Function with PDB structure (DUF3857)/Transglutaminase-like superfamily